MSRLINPLLIDAPEGTPLLARRYYRQASATATDVSFAKELANAQKPTPLVKSPSVSALAGVAPVNDAAVSSSVSSVTLDDATTSANVENVVSSYRASAANPGGAEAVRDTGDDVQAASSWRVDRSAANVNQDDEDFGFDDFLDIINPLEHVPILSTIYRELRGETIKPVARIAGDILYGAATGSILISGIASIIGAAYEAHEGEDPVTQIADALFDLHGSDTDEEMDAVEKQIRLAQADETDDKGVEPSDYAQAVAATTGVAPVVKTAPVKTAQAEIQTVAAVKQPYGGVMDMAAATRNRQTPSISASALASAVNVKGLVIGNTIYTDPAMSNAARLAILKAAKAAPTAAKETTAEAPLAAMSIPGSTPMDDKSLGHMVAQTTNAQSSGNQLPPELVRDMMLMALDKYKTASNLAPSEMTVGGVN